MIGYRQSRSGSAFNSLRYGLGIGQDFHNDFDPSLNKELLDERDPQLQKMHARAIAVASNNIDPYNPYPAIKANQQRWGKTQPKNQMTHYILSASDDDMQKISDYLKKEGRAYDLQACYQELADLGVEFAKKVYGEDYNIVATAHADGSNGQHVHVFTDTINPITGIKANYDYDKLEKTYPILDKLIEKYGIEPQAGLKKIIVKDSDGNTIYKKDKAGNLQTDEKGQLIPLTHIVNAKNQLEAIKLTHEEKNMIVNKSYSPVMELRNLIDDGLSNTKVKSKKDLINYLNEHGVSVDDWQDNHKNIKFHWDIIKEGKHKGEKGMTITSYRLGALYSKKNIENELQKPPQQRDITIHRLLKEKAIKSAVEQKNKIKQRKLLPQSKRLNIPASTHWKRTHTKYGVKYFKIFITPKEQENISNQEKTIRQETANKEKQNALRQHAYIRRMMQERE